MTSNDREKEAERVKDSESITEYDNNLDSRTGTRISIPTILRNLVDMH